MHSSGINLEISVEMTFDGKRNDVAVADALVEKTAERTDGKKGTSIFGSGGERYEVRSVFWSCRTMAEAVGLSNKVSRVELFGHTKVTVHVARTERT